MNKTRLILIALVCFVLGTGSLFTAEVDLEISGPGVVNDSTVKVGEPFSVDIYWENDSEGWRGFSNGFCIESEDIKKIVHLNDTVDGMGKNGEVKGYNGWENSDVWDFAGVWVVPVDWDGSVPDTMGFGGQVIKNRYGAHPRQKVLSWDMIMNETGTFSIDSCFYRPGGYWKLFTLTDAKAPIEEIMGWDGPHVFHVIKK